METEHSANSLFSQHLSSSNPLRLSERIITNLKNGKLTDCAFIVDGVEVKAHKLVLATYSPVFEKMFFGNMSSSCSNQAMIQICDINLKHFNEMLNYIYMDNLIITSVGHAWQLYYIANKYLLDDLSELCLHYIKKNITLSNILLCYEYADMYNLKELQLQCITDVCDYFKGIFITDYHMKPSTLYEILKRNPFIKDYYFEYVIYLLNWAVVECDEKKMCKTAENVVDILEKYNIIEYIFVMDLLESKCIRCGATVGPLNCQCFGDLIYNCMIILMKNCNQKMSTRKQFRKNMGLFNFRKLFKIAHRMELPQTKEYFTIISVNKNIVLFGFLVDTQTKGNLSLLNIYEGSITIRVFLQQQNANGSYQIGKTTIISDIMKYDEERFIWLDDLIVLQPNKHYEIRISFENYLNKYPCSFICYYMNNSLTRKSDNSKICFYEISGGIIKGLSFYPL